MRATSFAFFEAAQGLLGGVTFFFRFRFAFTRERMRRALWASLILIVIQFAAAFYLYPGMPERVAVHWGLSGEADGFGSRFEGLFMIPVLSAVLLPVLLALPRLDPSGGIDGFRGGFDWFVFGMSAFLSYVFGLTLLWNLGWRFDFMRVLAPALGGLYYGIGVLMERAKLNWFVGIRSPWTLSSEEVWDRTHETGGRLFKVCGVLALGGVLAGGRMALLLTVAPVLAATIYLYYYSYSEYQKRAPDISRPGDVSPT